MTRDDLLKTYGARIFGQLSDLCAASPDAALAQAHVRLAPLMSIGPLAAQLNMHLVNLNTQIDLGIDSDAPLEDALEAMHSEAVAAVGAVGAMPSDAEQAAFLSTISKLLDAIAAARRALVE